MTKRIAATGRRSWTSMTWAEIVGLTLLLTALFSFNYTGLALPTAIVETPLPLILIGFIDTLLLGYLVTVSQWKGWMEWGAVFSVFYGVNYVLTAIESVYLPSVLPANLVFSLLVNGAIASGIFAAVLALVLGGMGIQTQATTKRLEGVR